MLCHIQTSGSHEGPTGVLEIFPAAEALPLPARCATDPRFGCAIVSDLSSYRLIGGPVLVDGAYKTFEVGFQI